MSKRKNKNQNVNYAHQPVDRSENLKDYLPKKASDYAKEPSEKEKKEALEFEEMKKHVKHESEQIPPLSQSEREHLTYLRVLGMYNDLQSKQKNLRKYGILFILCSAVIYLLLMFSLESKIEFLVLWIATVLFCIFLMIRADYNYHTFKELLGIADQYDFYDYDEDDESSGENSEIPPEPVQNTPKSVVNANSETNIDLKKTSAADVSEDSEPDSEKTEKGVKGD